MALPFENGAQSATFESGWLNSLQKGLADQRMKLWSNGY